MDKKILNETIVKTKSKHACYGCGRSYEKGTNMSSASCRINGVITRKYFCESCHHEITKKCIAFDSYSFGDLLSIALLYEKSTEK